MAHFAKLDENNIVIRVHRVGNDIATSEQAGIDYLQKIHNTDATFKQTSYNTKGGVHYGQNGQPDGGVALRKNYAGKGYTYDESRDAFKILEIGTGTGKSTAALRLNNSEVYTIDKNDIFEYNGLNVHKFVCTSKDYWQEYLNYTYLQFTPMMLSVDKIKSSKLILTTELTSYQLLIQTSLARLNGYL